MAAAGTSARAPIAVLSQVFMESPRSGCLFWRKSQNREGIREVAVRVERRHGLVDLLRRIGCTLGGHKIHLLRFRIEGHGPGVGPPCGWLGELVSVGVHLVVDD